MCPSRKTLALLDQLCQSVFVLCSFVVGKFRKLYSVHNTNHSTWYTGWTCSSENRIGTCKCFECTRAIPTSFLPANLATAPEITYSFLVLHSWMLHSTAFWKDETLKATFSCWSWWLQRRIMELGDKLSRGGDQVTWRINRLWRGVPIRSQSNVS